MKTFAWVISAALAVPGVIEDPGMSPLQWGIQGLQETSAPDLSIQTLRVSDEDLIFFRSLGDFMQSLHRMDPAVPKPAFKNSCAAEQELESLVEGSDSEELKFLKADLRVCRDLNFPFDILIRRGPPVINSESMSSIEGLLQSILVVGSKVQWPGPFQQANDLRHLQNIIRKIQSESLGSRILNRQRILDQLLSISRLNEQELRAVAGARTEIDELSRDWNQFVELSQIQAAGDLASAKCQNKSDVELPYPLLSKGDRIYLSMIIGGFMWRFRGAGGYDDFGTNDRRKYFARLPFETLATLNGASPSVALQTGWALWLGLKQSWGRYHDMGRMDGDKHSDFQAMGRCGRFLTGFATRALSFAGYDSTPLRLAGEQVSPCYYYSFEALDPSIRIGVDLPKPFLFIIGGPSNFGELCTGAALGLGLAQTLLQGCRR